MNLLLKDPVFWIYLSSILMYFYLAVVFLFWWVKVKSANTIYKAMVFLFAGLSISRAGAITLRIVHHVSLDDWIPIVKSKIWIFRILPESIALLFVVVVVTKRIYRTYRDAYTWRK